MNECINQSCSQSRRGVDRSLGSLLGVKAAAQLLNGPFEGCAQSLTGFQVYCGTDRNYFVSLQGVRPGWYSYLFRLASISVLYCCLMVTVYIATRDNKQSFYSHFYMLRTTRTSKSLGFLQTFP